MVHSRNKWNDYERKLAQEYRELWFAAKTSRAESKTLDDRGIDLAFTDPFAIQAKCYKNYWGANIIRTLEAIETDTLYKILHLKVTRVWEVVCLPKEDWYELVKMMRKEWIIK